MKIAIGLPTGIPNTPGRRLVEWAQAAEQAGFSSVGTIGRIVFDSHEELVALAAAAGATSRLGLATTVMVGPVREAVLLAKQAATLDAVSGGRLTLGIGVGWRDDDFRATGTDHHARGRTLDRQLEVMRRVWRGETPRPGVDTVGPKPARAGGPEILLGGSAPAALRRAGRLADGYLAMPAPPPDVKQACEAVAAAWQEAGRPGRPRLVGSAYYVLGDAGARGDANMAAYYAFGGEPVVKHMQSMMLRTDDAVRERIAGLEAIGIDEFFLWPTVAELDQIARLREVVG